MGMGKTVSSSTVHTISSSFSRSKSEIVTSIALITVLYFVWAAHYISIAFKLSSSTEREFTVALYMRGMDYRFFFVMVKRGSEQFPEKKVTSDRYISSIWPFLSPTR